MDGPDIRCDVFPGSTVTPCRCLDQDALLITEVDCQPVKLEFRSVLNRCSAEFFSDPPVKCLDFSSIEAVLEGKHRNPVLDFLELCQRCTAYPLCG